MTHNIFLYGTLCDPELYAIVGGVPLAAARSARLPGHAVFWVRNESFPIIVAKPDRSADGLLVQVDDATKARLDFYELGFHYTLCQAEVELEGTPAAAEVYFPAPNIWPVGDPWSLSDWQAEYGPLTREAATEYMRLIETHAPEAAAEAFPRIRARASSRVRARAFPSPQAFEPAFTLSDIDVRATRQPYTDYFAVREDDLTFPAFDGARSAEIKRSSFMGGDAVTVLPYDPRLDSVLIVRQFRHGPFVRGDSNPWTLEPAAGRIDPGEDPEATARRELFEETGVDAKSLHRVADYYPTPGAFSEFLISYVAIADLSDRDGATAGLDDEHEDIMSHVVSFDRLLEMAETGAANTGPLVLSALWLARHRNRLRATH